MQTLTARRPRGAVSGARLTAAALLSLASFAASINLVFAALVRMGEEFGVRPELLASLSAVYFAAFTAVAVGAGIHSDRFGARAPLLLGNLLTLAGGLIFASARGGPALVLGITIMGLGGGATEGMCTALLARLFPGRERLTVGVSQAGYCLGAILGPYVMGIYLPQGVPWRVFFIPVAALALINAALFAGSRFPAGNGRPARPADEGPAAPDTTIDTTDRLFGLRRSLFRWCVVIFLYVTAETALVSFVNIYLFTYRAAPERAAIQSIAWFWGVMLVGRLLCSALPPRFADRAVIAGGMTAAAAAIVLTIPAPDWRGALAAFLLASFLMAGAWPTIVARGAREDPQRTSTAVGVLVAAGSLGCIVAPPLMAWLFAVAPPTIAMAAPALSLLAGGLLALDWRRSTRETPDAGASPGGEGREAPSQGFGGPAQR